MIINEVFKRPIISFGLGMTMLSCEVGDDVTVWQNEVYNGDEYFMVQDEKEPQIQLRYNTLTFLYTDFFATFIQKETLYNGRVYFESTIDGDVWNIVWNLGGWYIVTNLESSFDVIAIINQDVPLPISDGWGEFEPSIAEYAPRSTTLINVNPQGFTFPATETKPIQIEIVNKRTGQVAKSNTIQLIVNSSSS